MSDPPFILGAASRARLAGVHPRLVAVVQRAIALTTQDFAVLDGMRTLEVQRDLVQRGASKTMQSMHLKQPDGYGHAVDLVPCVGGQPRWEWPLIYPVAHAVRVASAESDVRLTWGAVWDRRLDQLPASAEGLAQAVRDYAARHPGPDFLDGPHYQLAA